MRAASLEELKDLYKIDIALGEMVGFVLSHPDVNAPGSEEAAIFDALWRAWRGASQILNSVLPPLELLKLFGWPERFPGPKRVHPGMGARMR